MTIRKTPLAIALLAALLVGGVAVLAGVTPMWRGRVDDLRDQTGVLAERSDTLHNEVLRLTRQREDLLGQLDAASRQAFENQEQLRHSVTGMEARLEQGRQTADAYRRTLDDERTVANRAITTANEQLLALEASLRQSVVREGARSQQAATLQGALKTLDDQRIAERDRLLADLGRSQRDTAVMQNHAAQVATAAREAERVAGNRLATLQHELRQWQKQADEAESRLADAQRQWRREHARQRDDRRSSDTKAGALQKKVDRLTGELAKAQSDLAEANRRIAALESRPSGQRKVRLGRPVSDSSDN